MEFSKSLFYYTNNIVPAQLFQETLKRCVDAVSQLDDTELVITSHYPVTYTTDGSTPFVDVSDSFTAKQQESDTEIFTQVVVSGKLVDVTGLSDRVKSFVVGPLQRDLSSILLQLQYSLSQSSGDYILMQEHDVFYPEGYHERMFAALEEHEIAVAQPHTFLCANGFFRGHSLDLLSRYGARRNIWNTFTDHCLQHNIQVVEPLLGGRNLTYGDHIPRYDDFVLVDDISPTLDVRHGLNASGGFIIDEYNDSHEYWGHKDRWLNMIDKNHLDFIDKNQIYLHGLVLV